MRPAEIIFRIVAGLGGWLVLLSHAITLAALPAADCTTGDDAVWRGTLVFAVVAGLAVLLCSAGHPWRRSLRFAPLLAAPLVAYDIWWIAGALVDTTLGRAPLCAGSDLAATAVQRAWPIAQLLVLAGTTVQGIRTWRA